MLPWLKLRVVPLCLCVCMLGASVLPACAGTSGEEAHRSMVEFRLARTYRSEGDPAGALQHARRAIALDHGNVRAHILLAHVQLERGTLDEAEEAVRTAIGLLGDATNLEGVVAEARNLLGVILTRQERFEEAVVELRASANDELNRAPWYAWGNLGSALYESGDAQGAEQALNQAVEIQPRFCLGHYLLGKTLFGGDRYEEAELSLTAALEADERCGQVFQQAYRLRGETRARLGKNQPAVLDFERCVELAPRSDDGRSCQRFLETVQ